MKRVLSILNILALSVLFSGGILIVSSGDDTNAERTIDNNAVSFWRLNEASGERADCIWTNHLTDYSSSAVSATGKLGNAIDLESSSAGQYLFVTDKNSLSFDSTESFTLSAWIKLETDGLYIPVIWKGSELNDAKVEYGIYLFPVESNTENIARMAVGNGVNISFASSTARITTGSWFHLCGWHDTTTDSIYIAVNGETPVRAKALYGPKDLENSLAIGSFIGETYSNFDGLVDAVGVWNRCPTYTDGYAFADSLYNSGNGVEL